MQDNMQHTASGLRELRHDRRLSLEAVGYLAGVDAATVSRIERGVVEPERETVVKLAQALGLSVTRLRSLIEPHHPEPAAPDGGAE